MQVAAVRGMRIRFDRGTLVLEAETTDEDPSCVSDAVWDAEHHAWRVPAERHAELSEQLAAAGVVVTDELRRRGIAVEWRLPALR